MATHKSKLKTEKSKQPVYMKLILLVLFIVISIEIAAAWNINHVISVKKTQAEEITKPARLSLIELVDPSCTNCFNITLMSNSIAAQKNVANVTNKLTLQFDSSEAKALIAKYNVTRMPSLIVQGDFKKSNVVSLWGQVSGIMFSDGVLIPGFPPYNDLTTGQTVGLVRIILLSDNSCSECYDVNGHKLILPGFGVKPVSEDTVDISSTQGKGLLAKYNITKVPTLLVSPEASAYPALTRIWTQVGNVEPDGWYVFRATELMGIYKDLTSNTIVNATK